MTIKPFHAACVADVARTLKKTCAGCIAAAEAFRSDTETVDGYLIRVAGTARPAPDPAGGEAAVLQDWFRARKVEGLTAGQAANMDRLAFAAMLAAQRGGQH